MIFFDLECVWTLASRVEVSAVCQGMWALCVGELEGGRGHRVGVVCVAGWKSFVEGDGRRV